MMILLSENVLLHVRVPLAGLVTKVNTGFHHLRNEFVNHCMCMCCVQPCGRMHGVLEGAALSPQPSVVGIAASAGTGRILPTPLNVNQIHAKTYLFFTGHACGKHKVGKEFGGICQKAANGGGES